MWPINQQRILFKLINAVDCHDGTFNFYKISRVSFDSCNCLCRLKFHPIIHFSQLFLKLNLSRFKLLLYYDNIFLLGILLFHGKF